MAIFAKLFGRKSNSERQQQSLTNPKGSASGMDTGVEAPQRYALNWMHATGGMGRVWLAHDAQMARDVALNLAVETRQSSS